ncbi:centromere-associated protein E-like [Phymastichus coffea]|uniref:centromere-associated protein E-like n=1 Tax=Phymastichus coffea TaxID=108790 RepID=UPI00273A7792|nr:centromere-associated protein E-like [Phymastichus coffea]
MSDSIQVAIKVRPLIKREKDENLQIQWTVVDNVLVPTDPEKKRGEKGFQFDHIFDPDKTNNDVFETVVKPIVDAAVKGFNGTVFAYGQTSSGKTYTMLGTETEPGVIPMAVEHMFDSIAETCGREFLLRVSYLEIYNEKVNDLLDTNTVDLKLREDNNGLVQVLKCKEEIASSPDAIMAVMKKGDKNRRIGETDMNERSSRSHTIFRITIESRDMSSDSDGAIQVSQLNLVDLAGSERISQTNATGERFKEGTHINMSLSTLGLVIKQLSESAEYTKYVNFRDSKLTRLLQASLGGNAMTTIICAVTPAAFEETQCTLWFASRAKSVKNKPQLNEVMSDAALLKRYKKQLAKLTEELDKIKTGNFVAEVQEMESKLQEKDRLNQLLEERIELLKNGLISANSATKDDVVSKIPKSKRRRTWAGDRGLSSRFSLLPKSLPTIEEVVTVSPESKSKSIEKANNYNKRKSIIQTVNFNEESFETEFTDFELELIKVAKEREEETNSITDSVNNVNKIAQRLGNRVKFQDDVEIHRLSSGSYWSDMSITDGKFNQADTKLESSPGTPKSVLREKLSYTMAEYEALREFCILEKQAFAEESNFESPAEKIFLENQIETLHKRLEKYSIYQTELEEQATLSLSCIYHLSTKVPNILELWKPKIFSEEKGEIDILSELKYLLNLLTSLKNEQQLTSLEKKLSFEYNECLQELEQIKSQNELLATENNELQNKLADESNKLKEANMRIKNLANDTDCLMANLLQKDTELANLKEKMVKLERVVDEMNKSTNESALEIVTEKGTDVSFKLNITTDAHFDRDAEIARLNEMIEEKTNEITKLRKFEKEIKIENECLQESLNKVVNIDLQSTECQTEKFPESDSQVENQMSQLDAIIQEKTLCITHHQQIEMEMKHKIEDLQKCLDAFTKIDKTSQECQTVEELQPENSNNIVVNQNEHSDILKLSKLVKEKDVEIINCKQVHEQLRKEIKQLEIAVLDAKTDQQYSTQTFHFNLDQEDNNIKIDSDKGSQICRLEDIIKEQSLEITCCKQSEVKANMLIEKLQHCLKDSDEQEKNKNENIQTANDPFDLHKNKDSEISKLLEIIQLKSSEIENYKQSEEELLIEIEQLKEQLKKTQSSENMTEIIMNEIIDNRVLEMTEIVQSQNTDIEKYKHEQEKSEKEIQQLQDHLDKIIQIKPAFIEFQTESVYDKEIKLLEEKDKKILNQQDLIHHKTIEIKQYKQLEQHMKEKIEKLMQSLNTKEIEQSSTETDEISRLSTLIEEKDHEISHCKQIEQELETEIERLRATSAQMILAKPHSTQNFEIADDQMMHVDEDKDDEVSKLLAIVYEKTFEITKRQQVQEELEKELKKLRQCRYSINAPKQTENQEIQTEKDLYYDNEKIAEELEMSNNKIKNYQDEIEILKQQINDLTSFVANTNSKSEETISFFEKELNSKITDLRELESLNSELQKCIDRKTEEMVDMQQSFNSKVSELEQKLETVLLERNELKEKVDAGLAKTLKHDFEENTANLKNLVEKLKSENEELKHLAKLFEANRKINSSINALNVSGTLSKCNMSVADSTTSPNIKSNMSKTDTTKEVEANLLDADNFVKPSCVTVEETELVRDSSKVNDFAKAQINKNELESSSIFANQTYFDNMEVGQSFAQNFTGIGFDESKDVSNISTNIDATMTNHISISEKASNISVMSECNKNMSKCEDLSISATSVSLYKLDNESLTLEELNKFKVVLEKDNARLRLDLQKKIHETEEIQRVLSDFKQTLGQLQQTIDILTNENMDMSKQLSEERESRNQVVSNFQREIDALSTRLSSVSEEKTSLKSELALLTEQFDNVRAISPVISDDVMKQKIGEYQEEIRKLNEENIALSTNLMDKIEELEKVKESKVQLYDHECIYKDKCDELIEKLQSLEKENIDLSSDLTDHIEECDKLKETVEILNQQLEFYKVQQSSEYSNNSDFEFLKQENMRLINELIEVKSKQAQLVRENANLSSNLMLDISNELNQSTSSSHDKTTNVPLAPLDLSSSEANSNILNVDNLNKKVKLLQEQVDHLTSLNKKLGELKLTACSQCIHLKELNESRRELKLQVKELSTKLIDVQKKFEQKSADVEVLKAKAKEDFEASMNYLDSTHNSSIYDGMNVTVLEGKVKNLQNELEEVKENHNELSNQYKEKCKELENLQLDSNSLLCEKSDTRRSKLNTPSRKISRVQALHNKLDDVTKDLRELKKSNANTDDIVNKVRQEHVKFEEEIESLKLLNEELKKENETLKGNSIQYEEKVKLLEEDLSILYKKVETASASEKEFQAYKLEIEVQLESLLKEKSELESILSKAEERFKGELEECNARANAYKKENIELKNELQKLEDSIQQIKKNSNNYLEEKLKEEIDTAKVRMLKEMKSLVNLSFDELKELSNKSVTDMFLIFLTTIMTKEGEIVKKLYEDHEKNVKKLKEEYQQSDDAANKANNWAKTLETDLEKLQVDLTEQERKNRRFEDEVRRLEENLKEAQYENQQLHNNIISLESEINSLQIELDKKSKSNSDRDNVITAALEKEKLARTKEQELEDRLRHEKEKYERAVKEHIIQLESYKSVNEDLRSTVEGQDLEIEHFKNTINIKNQEVSETMRKIMKLEQTIQNMEEANQIVQAEVLEKNKNIEEITNLMKIKCDLLTEYKTKVETMKPEFESLHTQIADRKAAIEKYKEDIHNMKLENKKQLDMLQDKLSDEEIKSAGLSKQLAELKNKNTALCTTIEEFKDRCAELERNNANLQRKVRNSTSKVRVENEMQELQDENRSLKNHLEGSYNRIKELQESKSQVQLELTEAQAQIGLLEQELNTTRMSLDSLREKYNNEHLQELREKYELLLREINSLKHDIQEKNMLLADKDQKLTEYNIDLTNYRKEKTTLNIELETIKREKVILEQRISILVDECEYIKRNIAVQKDEAYKALVLERDRLLLELEKCQKEQLQLENKNKELDEEAEEMSDLIQKQENEIAELRDRLITGSSSGSIEKVIILEDENEKLKIDLRVTELNYTKLQNEVVRLNLEKEKLICRIEDLNSVIGELEAKNSSRNSSKSNSPNTQRGRRRRRRSDVYNQNRNLDLDNERDITDIESPSSTPTPPNITTIIEECKTCSDLRNRIREMSIDLVSRNSKITQLELQLQAENFPYQMKCNELKENLLAANSKYAELKLENKKLQRALMQDSSRECHVCRHKKLNKRDQSVQANPEHKFSLTGVGSGMVEDHLKLQKLEKEKIMMKDLCRNRAKKIKELEERVKVLEGIRISTTS